LNIRTASVRLLAANCPCALAMSGAHLGPFVVKVKSADITVVGADDDAEMAAVAMGCTDGRITNSQPK
jgi:hypothetical protein